MTLVSHDIFGIYKLILFPDLKIHYFLGTGTRFFILCLKALQKMQFFQVLYHFFGTSKKFFCICRINIKHHTYTYKHNALTPHYLSMSMVSQADLSSIYNLLWCFICNLFKSTTTDFTMGTLFFYFSIPTCATFIISVVYFYFYIFMLCVIGIYLFVLL